MRSYRTLVLRALTAVVALAGVALTVLNVVQPHGAVWTTGSFVETDDPSLLPSRIANSLVWGAGCGLLAVAIAWRVSDRPSVLLAGLWLALLSAVPQFQASVLASEATLPAAAVLAGLMNATGIRFTQLFPQPLGPEALRALTDNRFARATALRCLVWLLNPWLLFPAVVLAEFTAIVLAPTRSALMLVLSSLALVASANLLAGLRSGGPEDRRKIFWIFEGVVVFLAGNVLLAAVAAANELRIVQLDLLLWSTWLDVLKGTGVVSCFALALFYTGAFDAGMVVRRSAVYSAAGGFFVLVFITLETAIAEWIPGVLGLQSTWGALVAGVVAALTFRPVSDFVDAKLKRWTSAQESDHHAEVSQLPPST